MIRRNGLLSVFVAAWLLLFACATLRARPICLLTGFSQIEPRYGFAEVYGLTHGKPERIAPHTIFPLKHLGCDNMRRNILVSVLDERVAPSFCPYLQRKFPAYEDFLVVAAEYPDLIAAPERLLRQPLYRCR